MSEQDRMEELSALVDDELAELPARRLTNALVEDDDLREHWDRYHLIGAAMRKEYEPGLDVAARVRAALEAEPAAVAAPPAQARRGLRPITGFAIAASVAAVALVSVRLFTDVGGVADPGKQEVAAIETTVPQSGVSQVVLAPQGPTANRPAGTPNRPAELRFVREEVSTGTAPRQLTQAPELAPDAKARLNRYLLDHAQSTRTGMRAMFPYAALVGYEER